MDKEFIDQLEWYLLELCEERTLTPWIFFKARWELEARIDTTKSILKVAKAHSNDRRKN